MSYSIDKKKIINYSPENLKSFYQYMYEWIDNLNFTLNPSEILENASEYIDFASSLFLEMGWDGVGDIQLMWIPPFMLNTQSNIDDYLGITIWHVKQEEDGFSWILSPIELPISH